MTPNVGPITTHLLAGVVVVGGLGGMLAVLATQTPPSLRIPLVVSALWHLGLLAAVAHVGYGALHVDDPVRYDQISAVIADQARGGMMPNFKPFTITSFGYYCWVAAFYEIFGHHPLIPQLVNILLALVAGILTHRMTRRVGGSERAAWLAAVAVLLYPTLAVWSVMLLKDILAVVALLLCVDLALTLSQRPVPWAWPLLAACAFAVSTIRFYVGILGLGMGIVIGLAGCVQAVRWRHARNATSTRSVLLALAGSVLLVVTLVGAFHVGEGPWYLQVLVKRSFLTRVQTRLSGGGSSLVAARRLVSAPSGASAPPIAGAPSATGASPSASAPPVAGAPSATGASPSASAPPVAGAPSATGASPSASAPPVAGTPSATGASPSASAPPVAGTPSATGASLSASVPPVAGTPPVVNAPTPEDFAPTGGGAGALSRGGSWVWKIVRFFLVPLPSQTGDTLVQIGKLDGLFWWPLIVLALRGLRQGFSTSWQGTLIVALPIVILAIFYSVVLSNAGTILRYRAGLFPLGAVLAALGVDGLAATAPARVRVLWKRFA